MTGDGDNTMVQNRSMLREFVASIATMSGDLSNITAPPFVLDTKSTVELPQFWAERPSIFCAPAHSDDPAVRALLVLKWYLSCLRSQNYMGRAEGEGVKKPLNAFLGELFLGHWDDPETGITRLVSEQVSHHPPVTACRVWNDEHGVAAEGYTRQTITFNGSVNIMQTGHALFTLSKRDNETYLIPLPNIKIKGVITGAPYPELTGTYHITSTNGYHSVIDFSGKSAFWFGGGEKNSFEARVYHESTGEAKPLYTVKGQWNKKFTIHDTTKNEDIETFDVTAKMTKSIPVTVEPLDEQDPWETRNAWRDVISSLNTSDMPGTAKAKSRLEQGQRNMRREHERSGEKWESVFFRTQPDHPIVDELMNKIPSGNAAARRRSSVVSTTSNTSKSALESESRETMGIWRFEQDRYSSGQIQQPYHGEWVPDNSHSADNRSSIDSSSRRSSIALSNRGSPAPSPRASLDSKRQSHVEPVQRLSRLSISSDYSAASANSEGSVPASPRQQSQQPQHQQSSRLRQSPQREFLPSPTTTTTRNERPRNDSVPIAETQSQSQSRLQSEPQQAPQNNDVPNMTTDEKENVEELLRETYKSNATEKDGILAAATGA